MWAWQVCVGSCYVIEVEAVAMWSRYVAEDMTVVTSCVWLSFRIDVVDFAGVESVGILFVCMFTD